MEKFKKMIIDILEDSGFIIFDDKEQDFCISDYIVDSLQFMNFIMKIEEQLGTHLPDDFLGFDILDSVNGLANKLLDYCLTNGITY